MFHWACLDKVARSLPATTAPAGYTCPKCNTCLFPPSNLISPVADVLKEKLAGVNWARIGLGLPLVSIICYLFKNVSCMCTTDRSLKNFFLLPAHLVIIRISAL